MSQSGQEASRKQLSAFVNVHADISVEMAIRLDKAFGGGVSTWYRLQAAYDLGEAMKQADRIRIERLSPVAQRMGVWFVAGAAVIVVCATTQIAVSYIIMKHEGDFLAL